MLARAGIDPTPLRLCVAAILSGEGQALPAADILAEICAAVLPSLTFPKKMQWIGKDCTFGRPVRWLLAMLDDKLTKKPQIARNIALQRPQSYCHVQTLNRLQRS